MTRFHRELFFGADDNVHGDELWRSDGTASGTRMVRDICRGAFGSYLYAPARFHHSLFFAADDGAGSYQLWRSDGSRRGTKLVKAINAPYGSYPGLHSGLEQAGGLLFFGAKRSVPDGTELWRSNGTARGTKLVKEINPGRFDEANPRWLTNVRGTLLFVAGDGSRAHGTELWKSDGTASGTKLVADLNPGEESSAPRYLKLAGGRLFFWANDGLHGFELWEEAL